MSQFNNIQDWASGDLGEGAPTLPIQDIQDNVEADISQLGQFHTDISDLPLTASGRANGIFASYDDLLEYLEGGGLVLRNENLEPVPNPIIHIVRQNNEYSDGVLYYVYIDEESA